MPLIPCPDCDHQVSDTAPTCPSCGRPLEDHVQTIEQTGKQFKFGYLVVIILLFMGIANTCNPVDVPADRHHNWGWICIILAFIVWFACRIGSWWEHE